MPRIQVRIVEGTYKIAPPFPILFCSERVKQKKLKKLLGCKIISTLENIHLFIWLHHALVAARGIFIASCGPSVVVQGLSSCGVQALECTGSVAVA